VFVAALLATGALSN